MFTPAVRFSLLLLFALLSVVFAMYNLALPLVVASFLSLFLLWDYLKRGTVPLAVNKIKKEDYTAAEKIISYTRYPNRLLKQQQVYYGFVQGFIEREKNNFNKAEEYLNLVKGAVLKNENDRAMVLLALADMQLIKKNKTKAKELLMQMKDLKVEPTLMPQIRQMQQWLGA